MENLIFILLFCSKLKKNLPKCEIKLKKKKISSSFEMLEK